MKIMHSLLYVVVVLVGLIGHFVHGCPTCVGKLEQDSPAFFADEYYQAPDADETHKNETDTVSTQTTSHTKEK